MKICKPHLLLLIIISIALLLVFYIYNKTPNPKTTIKNFFDMKSALYENYDNIMSGLFLQEDVDIFLGNFKPLLSEKVYDGLIASRYLINSNLVSGKFDKSKINIKRWEKISKDKTNVKYLIEYTEKLYSNETIIEEYTDVSEFKLEYIDGKWIITSIYIY